MSFNIEVQGGKNYLLPTGGKYCPQDIEIAAIGGAGGMHVWSKSLSAAGEILEYVTDDDINAYPENGEQDGFYYVRLSVPLFIPTEDFEFTDTYILEEKTLDDIEYWMLTFTESGSLNIKKEGIVGDICVCGGGGGGLNGANGGHGGFVNNFFSQEIKSGEIIIGAGGGVGAGGGASSYGGFTANGATACAATYTTAAVVGGCSGGRGRGGYTMITGSEWKCTGQGTTTRPFAASELDPMGAGGGGGGFWNRDNDWEGTGGSGGTDGGNGGNCSGGGTGGGAGGNKGGGNGGNAAVAGTAGSYYGAGGGGGGWRAGDIKAGAAGYQGVVMIRIPKRRNIQK